MDKSEFYDYILPMVPGVDTPLVNFAIMRACKTLAEQSGLLRDVTFLPVVPLTDVYAIPLTDPLTTEVSSVFICRYFVNGTNVKLYPVTTQAAEWMTTMPPSPPTSWRFDEIASIQLYPTPSEVAEVRIETLLQPVFTIEGPVSDKFKDFKTQIADGALAFLFAMPGKPWTSEKASKMTYESFARSVLALRASLRSGGMPNNATLKSVSFTGMSNGVSQS